MREYELLAIEAQFCCAVLGSGTAYVLIPTEESYERTEQLVAQSVRRGLHFCGVIAVVRGQARSAYANADSTVPMMCAAPAFAELYVKHTTARCGDFIQWANRLWSLPDDRTPL